MNSSSGKLVFQTFGLRNLNVSEDTVRFRSTDVKRKNGKMVSRKSGYAELHASFG
jgi:hypothetical protein